MNLVLHAETWRDSLSLHRTRESETEQKPSIVAQKKENTNLIEENTMLPRQDTTTTDETSMDGAVDVPPSRVVIKRSDETAKTSLLSFDDSSEASEDEGWEPIIRCTTVTATTTTTISQAASISNGEWRRPYRPNPVLEQNTVLVAGFFLFVLSVVWPPLILLVAYVVSKLIPYSFRTNDCPTTRRKLFAEFLRQDDLPHCYRSLQDRVDLEDSYWTNQR